MAEYQVSEIKVNKENLSGVDCGGGYRKVTAHINVDKSLPKRQQRRVVTQEVLGVFLGSVVPTETLEEIAEEVCNALESL